MTIGADFRFEVPGQSSVGLIGGGRGQWLGGHHGECGARAYDVGQPPAGPRGRAPGQGGKAKAESIFCHCMSNGAGKFSPFSQI